MGGCAGPEVAPEEGMVELMEETYEDAYEPIPLEGEETYAEVKAAPVPGKIQVLNVDGSPDQEEKVVAYLRDKGYQIGDGVRVKGPFHNTKIFYKEGYKERALQMATDMEGKQYIQKMDWESPYEVVIMIGTLPETASATPTTRPQEMRPSKIESEIKYYVTASKYFKISNHTITRDGKVKVYLEKKTDRKDWYPKVTLKCYDKGNNILATDTETDRSSASEGSGFQSKVVLFYPANLNIDRMDIELKVYDQNGSLVLY